MESISNVLRKNEIVYLNSKTNVQIQLHTPGKMARCIEIHGHGFFNLVIKISFVCLI